MQIHETIQQAITYLRGIWRFRWYAMGIAWLIAIVGWVYVSTLPDQYEASAQVLVDTDSMLRPLLRGLAVESNIDQRVQLMTTTLISRPNLEKLARMTDLDIHAKTPAEMDALLARLKQNITLRSATRQDFYTISAVDTNAQTAKNLVESLLNIFIEDTLGNTRQDTDVAQKFLMEQIKEYEARLTEAENRIKEFKQKNIGSMPDTSRGYFEQLQSSQAELAQAKLLYKEALNRRDELKRQLMGEEPVFGFGSTFSAQSQGMKHPLDERIYQIKNQIDDLLLTYTENHPIVKAKREQLEALEREREEDLKSLPKVESKPVQQLEANPIYQQLKISLGQAEADVSSLSVRVEEYEKRVVSLKERVNTGPEIEAELQSLNRDYALNKQNYDTLVARLESAKLAEQAGQSGDDIKFQIINPPRVPLEPSGPNRLLLSTASMFAAIGAGISLAFLLSQLRPAIYDRRTLKLVSGYPVFGVVSRYWTPELLVKKRIEFSGFITVAVMLGLVYAGVAYVQVVNNELLNEFKSLVEALG
jgi:polysaccharide chain length determinant protein (PEP-CTERM system associated)